MHVSSKKVPYVKVRHSLLHESWSAEVNRFKYLKNIVEIFGIVGDVYLSEDPPAFPHLFPFPFLSFYPSTAYCPQYIGSRYLWLFPLFLM
jgi:hypothetical protein